MLFHVCDNPELSRKARAAIADGKNLVFISAVVIWEIRIKQALGKLAIPQNFQKVLNAQSFEMLDITVEHAHAIKDLPAHHQDPFRQDACSSNESRTSYACYTGYLFEEIQNPTYRGLGMNRILETVERTLPIAKKNHTKAVIALQQLVIPGSIGKPVTQQITTFFAYLVEPFKRYENNKGMRNL